jgi:AmmeMemoRadiSam system protein B
MVYEEIEPMNEYPLFRNIMAVPADGDEERMISVYDQENYSDQSLMVSSTAYYLMTLMNGARDIEKIENEFFRISGQRVGLDNLRGLVKALDDALFLDNERFKARKEALRKEFLGLPSRPCALAGKSYPAQSGELAEALDASMAGKPLADPSLLKAIVVPHIDFRVGGDLMGAGWREAADSGAQVYVILGVGHSLSEDFVSCLDKDFDTPVGTMRVNSAFIGKLAENFGESVSTQPEVHRNEHSVEFQSLFMARLFAKRPEVTAVPILLSFPETVWETDHPKFNGARVDRFIEALRKTADECGSKVVYVASVDFSHVGRRFGDGQALEGPELARIESDDMRLIRRIQEADLAGFMEEIQKVNGANKVCGFPALFTMMGLTGPAKGKLLGYRQNVEGDRENVVTFAAMTISG